MIKVGQRYRWKYSRRTTAVKGITDKCIKLFDTQNGYAGFNLAFISSHMKYHTNETGDWKLMSGQEEE